MTANQKASNDFLERRSERRTIESNTRLRHDNWYSVEIKVRDVSQTGFMAECHDPILIGSHVSLDIPGVGPVHAQVRWQIGGRMGGRFLDPISLAQCEWTAVKAPPPAEAAA